MLDEFNTAGRDMDYWYLMVKPNVSLCLLIVDPPAGNDENQWRGVLDLYREVWNSAGTKGDKYAEIEQLDLLLDVLALTKREAAKPLRQALELVKKGLEKMV